MTNRALLVVDMQNGFCHPEGSFPRIGMGLDGAEAAVRNAAAAVTQARRAAIPVIFTRHMYRPGRPDEGPSLTANSPALAGVNGLADGYWDAEVVDELGCGPEDLVVDKVRFDAFQWTSLEPLLRGLGVGELVVCGVVTNLCVETTIRSAFMRDFPVTLLEDCCAAKTRRLHELSLEVLTSYELAEIARVSAGYDLGLARIAARVPLTALAAARHPSRNRPRKASATSTKANAVPCPDTTRSTMPTVTVPSHALTPAGARPSGRRHARAASQPSARPARKGHAVEATPAMLSPLAWLARPMTTNSSTQTASNAAASQAVFCVLNITAGAQRPPSGRCAVPRP
jgi:ureidoacrylate peracid hydrolase